MTPAHPEVHLKAQRSDEGCGPLIIAVRKAMADSGIPTHDIAQATDELLHAGDEGTWAVACRLVNINSSVAEELADLI